MSAVTFCPLTPARTQEEVSEALPPTYNYENTVHLNSEKYMSLYKIAVF